MAFGADGIHVAEDDGFKGGLAVPDIGHAVALPVRVGVQDDICPCAGSIFHFNGIGDFESIDFGVVGDLHCPVAEVCAFIFRERFDGGGSGFGDSYCFAVSVGEGFCVDGNEVDGLIGEEQFSVDEVRVKPFAEADFRNFYIEEVGFAGGESFRVQETREAFGALAFVFCFGGVGRGLGCLLSGSAEVIFEEPFGKVFVGVFDFSADQERHSAFELVDEDGRDFDFARFELGDIDFLLLSEKRLWRNKR